jgi:hypothetical protein
MTTRTSRWILWLGLALLAPVPILAFGSGRVPAGELATLALATLAVWGTQGGAGVVPLIFLVFALHAAAALLVWWLLAGLATRAVAGRSRLQRAVATLAALLAGVIVSQVFPIYRDPFRALPDAVSTSPDNASELPPDRAALPPPLPEPALPFARTESREPCAHFDPLRRPFWGDTHVHTALSFDAWGQGTRNTPRDAYRFARGEPVGIQPYGEAGRPLRTVQLRRPLDFAMVSDHAELLGEARICSTPGLAGHGSLVCRITRRWPMLGYGIVNSQMLDEADPVRYGFCGRDGERCREIARIPWREIQDAAEAAYDRSSACRFTSFVGFEWSGNPDSEMIHRNVVFRNEVAPQTLSNYIDDRTGPNLWRWMEEACLDRPDRCDVLAIPHNSNLSNGRLYPLEDPDGGPLSAETARRRAQLEVLLEVTQHKGDSECRAFANDELCNFETLRFARMRESATPWLQTPPPPLSYAREILAEGLVQQARLGENPFRLGLVGATDTHLGTPGLADEDRFVGHAAGMASARLRIPALPDDVRFNPGGLQAVWAEENSRDALFAAMRRRETYGTSGPRMRVRLFGGWGLPDDLCERPDFAALGYARGVPMGGDLSDAPDSEAGRAPALAIQALQDPGSPDALGTPLQRIQIVKIWEAEGRSHEKVFEVAGSPDNGAGVDLASCTLTGPGFARLCGVWRDPDFDPERGALYYARVVENPSCRWSTWVCNARGVDCSDPGTFDHELEPCCDAEVPKTIQERAWTSPIWYTPPWAGAALSATP